MVATGTPGAGGHGTHDVKCQNLEAHGHVISKKHVVALTVATTLTGSDSGATFIITSSGGAYDITLPVNAAKYKGVYYRFVCGAVLSSGAVSIKATTSEIIYGRVTEGEVDTGDNAPGSASGTGATNLILGTTCQTGDRIDMVSDGTNWFINGMIQKDAALTTS
mgnify:CR=1 FL=1